MKTITKICGIAAVAATLSASPAQASLTIRLFDTPNNNGSGPGASGGEFIAQVTGFDFIPYYFNGAGNNDPVYGNGFATFCLERSENVAYNTPYTASISLGAVGGGGGAVGGKDIISRGTAWLYTQFAQGTLGGYDWNYGSAGRLASAGYLQQALWWLEDEVTLSGAEVIANPYLTGANSVQSIFGDLTTAKLDTTSEYAVVVLNIYDADGNKIQDQLAIVPEPTTVIAGALLLLPFAASTIRILRKKREA